MGGSEDLTRWLERPQLTALAPGGAYSGSAPPVLLATVALDHTGRVTVDESTRSYSGLRLPRADADPATFRATSGGPVELTSGLTVDGNLGVGTASPGAKLEVVGGGDTSIDLLVNGRLKSNNNDGGLWVGSDRFVGGLDTDKIGLWNGNAWRLAVTPDGNVGIGTTSPGAKLEVVGGGDTSIDLLVNGRLKSNNNDGGLWVGSDRFVGGLDTDKIGFWNGNAWRLAVTPDGNVGIGTTYPGAKLTVSSDDSHLQLRREKNAPAGKQIFLELFQDNTPTRSFRACASITPMCSGTGSRAARGTGLQDRQPGR